MAGALIQPLVAGARSLAYVAADVQFGPADISGSRGFTAETVKRLEDLNLLSEALVARAGSGTSPAHEFRIEARMYRELLRQAMLGNGAQPDGEQLPRHLLLDMVRMSALLHSAADCKTGFVITCPADLMLQLKSQQSRVTKGLKMIQVTHK